MKIKRFLAVFLCLALWTMPVLADTSRALPTAYSESTFGGATRDFTVVAVWEALTDNDLVTATAGEVLTCYADEASYNQSFDVGGATADADYFRVIRAAPGHERLVHFDISEANVYGINVTEKYLGLYDLKITHHGNSADPRIAIYYRTADFGGCRLIGCDVKGENAGAGNNNGVQFSFSNATACIIANTSIVSKTYCVVVANTGAPHTNVRLYNSVIYGSSSYGFYSLEDATQYLKNVIEQNTSGWAGSINATTCLADDSADFVDAANRDFRLNAESPGIDDGTSLAADAVFPFTDDMYNTERPYGAAWDIGVYEWEPAPASSSIVPKRKAREPWTGGRWSVGRERWAQ